ncbi:class I SAM-dependent methyltransferase [Dictyobacter arantiisoli]|uniref:Methyltransferase domain-containing protein n=1 Tax=Dictyobacter arantiisoli TaxID=2014874 RepID=A0A5A5TCT9_9CHLR|nr:class I SAM-dependent methyltransferase [Dictyobacter arantiisoli]GCF08843.1 hypothetical protein KDI_24070 [Dictyobacter arantiisoli]
MGLFQWLWKGHTHPPTEQSEQLVTQGNRAYIKAAPYLLPKDDQEIDRLDLQHYIFRYMLHENYVAPLQSPNRILDVGCGTGRWALEMAETFPDSDIVGLDIIKPSQDMAQRPRNVLFLQRDILKGLPFTDQIFDYIHMRFLLGALPMADFQRVVNELRRVMKPGAWIELAEPGPVANAGVGLETLWTWLMELGSRKGIDMKAGKRLDRFLREAGLSNVTRKEINFPVGVYAGQAGELTARNLLSLLEAVREPIIALKIASAQDYDMMYAKAKTELANPQDSRNCFAPMYIAIAQQS